MTGKLKLDAGSTIDFPAGTTVIDVDAYFKLVSLKWAENITVLVDGEPLPARPNNVSITPFKYLYGPLANGTYYAYKGYPVYFSVDVLGISHIEDFQGIWWNVRNNTSADTKFVYPFLGYTDLTKEHYYAGEPGTGFDWGLQQYWASPIYALDGKTVNGFRFVAQLNIGASEASQDIHVSAVYGPKSTDLTYDFWGPEVKVFKFAAKDMPSAKSLLIKPENVTLQKGESQKFYAEVETENNDYIAVFPHDVTWKVDGNKDSKTRFDANGNGSLTVGADETAQFVHVTATTRLSLIFPNTVVEDKDISAYAIVYIGDRKDPSPAARPALGASHASPSSISLNWTAVTGATGYNLYQASSSAGSYQLIASNTQSLGATATGLATGSYYWFKAAAVDAKGEGALSDPIQVRARPLRPASINAAPGSKTGSVKVSWGSVAECDGYAVYVSTSRTGTYTLKSVVSGRNSLSAQVTGLKSGATYYFKVASYVQVGPAKVPSVYTGVVSAKAK
jgi:hypothetical protein